MHYSNRSVRTAFVGKAVPKALQPTWAARSSAGFARIVGAQIVSELSAMLRHVNLIDTVEIGR